MMPFRPISGGNRGTISIRMPYQGDRLLGVQRSVGLRSKGSRIASRAAEPWSLTGSRLAPVPVPRYPTVSTRMSARCTTLCATLPRSNRFQSGEPPSAQDDEARALLLRYVKDRAWSVSERCLHDLAAGVRALVFELANDPVDQLRSLGRRLEDHVDGPGELVLPHMEDEDLASEGSSDLARHLGRLPTVLGSVHRKDDLVEHLSLLPPEGWPAAGSIKWAGRTEVGGSFGPP
jgi:hypothetical protein